MDVLIFSFNSIAPILLLILLGYCGKRLGMLDSPTLKKVNSFNFRFGFSSLMFVNLYAVDTTASMPWSLVLFVVAVLVVLTAVGWVLAETFTKERSRKAVLMMAMFRSNYAVIGLVLVTALAGRDGDEIATIIQLPTVLYFNLVSTVILGHYSGSGESVDLRRTFREILTNPLILGLTAGAAALVIRHFLPLNANGAPVFSLSGNLPWLHETLTYLSRMSTPLALIVLGGQLELREVSAFRRELIAGVLMRLVLAPAIGFGLAFAALRCGWITLDASRYAMMIAAFGSPMAVASVIMSAEMNSDDKLCGQIVVWSSVLGMGSMFAITAILRTLGLV